MTQSPYPPATQRLSKQRAALAPEVQNAFRGFNKAVFADGALPAKTKQLIAVAAAHVTQCPYCIRSHTQLARDSGAEPSEIMEAIWVAAEMRAGAAYAHAGIAIDAMGLSDEQAGTDESPS